MIIWNGTKLSELSESAIVRGGRERKREREKQREEVKRLYRNDMREPRIDNSSVLSD